MVKIIKQKRKTLSLKVDNDWQVIVKVPNYASKKNILDFLEKYKDWILEKQELVSKNTQKFEVWEKFLFFWEYFELKFDENKKFFFDEKYFYTNLENSEEIKKNFIKFYKKEAKKYIVDKTIEFSKILWLEFKEIKINSAKTRWWSCNSKKNINFSFRLILAPKLSVDYVIIHELSHLKEMNHSRQFWNLVDNYCRWVWIWDYKKEQKWLKENYLKTNF